MSIPRSVAQILSEHVTLEFEGIDRIYLNVYVPRLQREAGVAGFFRSQRGHWFASSSVLMDPISKAFVGKGARKDDVAAQHLRAFKPEEEVLFIGKRRGRRRCFAPSGGATSRRAPPTPGWCAPRRWSIISTCTLWIGTLVPRASPKRRAVARCPSTPMGRTT